MINGYIINDINLINNNIIDNVINDKTIHQTI